MKTYSRTETIARMNALAGANVPFHNILHGMG